MRRACRSCTDWCCVWLLQTVDWGGAVGGGVWVLATGGFGLLGLSARESCEQAHAYPSERVITEALGEVRL